MITVRFPTGFSIQYNDANYVSRHAAYSDLLTKKDGSWIAQVPNTCVVEIVRPCEMYNGMSNAAAALDQVIAAARAKRYSFGDRRKIAELRQLLGGFSVRAGGWKTP